MSLRWVWAVGIATGELRPEAEAAKGAQTPRHQLALGGQADCYQELVQAQPLCKLCASSVPALCQPPGVAALLLSRALPKAGRRGQEQQGGSGQKPRVSAASHINKEEIN